MARTNHVKKARIDQGQCSKCGDEIKAGDPYCWWKPAFSYKHKRCAKPVCAPRPSDKTSSPHLGSLYAARENIEDAMGDRESLVSALNDAAETAREVGENYEESASNIEETFGETDQVNEIREKTEACEAWADALDNAATEIEGLEESDVIENVDADEDDDDREEQIEQALNEEATERASDAIGEL